MKHVHHSHLKTPEQKKITLSSHHLVGWRQQSRHPSNIVLHTRSHPSAPDHTKSGRIPSTCMPRSPGLGFADTAPRCPFVRRDSSPSAPKICRRSWWSEVSQQQDNQAAKLNGPRVENGGRGGLRVRGDVGRRDGLPLFMEKRLSRREVDQNAAGVVPLNAVPEGNRSLVQRWTQEICVKSKCRDRA